MHKGFRYKVILLIVGVLLMLSSIGYFGHSRFNGIIQQLSENAKPDDYYDLANALVSDSYLAENAVKTFRLTQDSSYLSNFYSAASKCELQLDSLQGFAQDSLRGTEIVRLDSLLEQKYTALMDLVGTQQVYRVQQALEQVSRGIQVTPEQTLDTVQKAQKTKRRGIFARIGRRTDTVVITNNASDQLEVLDGKVKSVRYKERRIENRIKKQEIALTEKIGRFDSEIQELLQNLEKNEEERRLSMSTKAQGEIRLAQNKILWYLIITGLLTILMTYLIVNYIKANRMKISTLRIERKQARKFAKEKEQFLAKVSHEIRTPLHAIGAFASKLQLGEGQKADEETVELIQKTSNHLQLVVNDLLDLSKLNAGKLELNMEPFALGLCIQESVAMVDAMKQEDQELFVRNHVPKSLVVEGDSLRLRQILINLLSNALKFTPKGKVELGAKWQNAQQLELTILDEGIGMSQDQLKRIFKPYEQADNSISKKFGGTGMGLPIVRELVRLHGGDIAITSEPNVGTQISINMPFKPLAKVIAPKPKNNNTKSMAQATKKVLVVDDVDYNLKIAGSMLDELGHDATLVENGNDALLNMQKSSYDLVLTDLRMPGMDGYELIREIQNSGAISPKPRIVVVSAEINKSDRDKLKDYACTFLQKPFNVSQLGDVLEHQAEPILNSVANTATISNQPDFEELRSMSMGDELFYVDMLESFLRLTKQGIDDLEMHLANNRMNELADTAHKLCPPCRHLSCNNMLAALKTIEKLAEGNEEHSTIKKTIDELKHEFEKASRVVEEEIERINIQ